MLAWHNLAGCPIQQLQISFEWHRKNVHTDFLDLCGRRRPVVDFFCGLSALDSARSCLRFGGLVFWVVFLGYIFGLDFWVGFGGWFWELAFWVGFLG